MPKIYLDRAFASRIFRLTWEDIQFGVEKGWLDPGVAVDFAIEQLKSVSDQLVTAIAFLKYDNSLEIGECIHRLNLSIDLIVLEFRWSKIIAAWLYEHRSGFDDPILELSSLFEDLTEADEDLRPITYYGSFSGVVRDLMEDWKNYLDTKVYGVVLGGFIEASSLEKKIGGK